MRFESSVNSYDSQTTLHSINIMLMFESSVNSYDSQTIYTETSIVRQFESSVNSYDSQTEQHIYTVQSGLRVV